MYRYLDSQHNPGNQMPFPQNHCPTCSASPPQMGYEWRPYCHACYNHSCFPGYYPPYHQMAPPRPFHWHGCRPTYPEPYPVHYASAIYHPAEQSDNHSSCGFPNYRFNNKGDNNVKIEEHEGDDGKKEKESLVPAGPKDCPYPIVWIPPGYMKNGENSAQLEQDKKEHSENCHRLHDSTPPESSNVWNMWFPPDSNGLRSLKQGGEGKKIQNSKEKNAHFPFPIIWMPQFEEKEEAEGKEHNQKSSASKRAEEPNLSFNIIPVKPLEVDNGGNKSRATQANSGGKGVLNNAEKVADQRHIPVKEREENIEEKQEGKVCKHGENGGKKKPSDSAKGQSSKLPPLCLRVDPLPRKKKGNDSSPSPPRQRGKSQETSNDATNGSSLSEGLKGSQETHEKKSHGLVPKRKEIKVVEVVEQPAGQNESHNQVLIQALPPDACPKVYEDPGVEKPGVAATECQAAETDGEKIEGKTSEEAIEEQKAMDKSQSVDHECKRGEDRGGSEMEDKKSNEIPKAGKRNLSDSEAAVIIQAAYRGFEVRKWELLKKSKQLAKVREGVDEIKNHIQALESLSDLQRDNRQRVVVGETIMRLLLKLDAIQGLHPDLRTIRKSLARELVSLQENLDSIMNQRPEVSFVEESAAKTVKTSTNIQQTPEEKEKEETEGLQDNASTDNCDGICNFMGPSQSPAKEDLSVDSTGKHISEPMFVADKIQVKEEKDTVGVEVNSTVEEQVAGMRFVLESKHEQDHGIRDSSQVVSNEPNYDSGLEGDPELALVTEKSHSEWGSTEYPLADDTIRDSKVAEKIVATEVVDSTPFISEGHLEMNELAQLPPQGTNEGNTDMNSVPELKKDDNIDAEGDILPEREKNEQIEAEGNVDIAQDQDQDQDQEGDQKRGDVTIADYETQDGIEPEQRPVQQTLEIHEIEALPQHVTEEEANVPGVAAEFKNDEKIEAGEVKVSDINQLQEHSVEAVTEDLARALLQKEGVFKIKELCHEEVKGMADEEAKEKALEGKFDHQEVEFAKGSETLGTKSAEGAQETGEEPDENEKLIEENKKLREMVEQLINAGKVQLTVVSNLTGRVKDLERKLSSKKKLRTRRHRLAAPASAPLTA